MYRSLPAPPDRGTGAAAERAAGAISPGRPCLLGSAVPGPATGGAAPDAVVGPAGYGAALAPRSDRWAPRRPVEAQARWSTAHRALDSDPGTAPGQGKSALGVVRRVALRCIPSTVGMNLEGGSWVCACRKLVHASGLGILPCDRAVQCGRVARAMRSCWRWGRVQGVRGGRSITSGP
jgi:hypothetical protein